MKSVANDLAVTNDCIRVAQDEHQTMAGELVVFRRRAEKMTH